ncbi:hypothetical protein HYH03_010506 [Edaphochlamys debaryana]|uniref:MIR domain-containing protein n=1 Tax=Edaphochlamys debaryana TaxID=47281 RepID=A0A835Y1X9_9CHLO|nr:hypothetical protein HYH03_010506 [Edaphochlamys debaryana]|eukprot:KAG2491060.1 hypothetical protein HYH03_010506 [Edaphochlamys debaryana]
MEDLAGRCLKYGDQVYFKVDGKQGFVSAHDRALPQVRVEELSDAADSPPDLKDCLFEITKKFQYTQKQSLINGLARNGLVPEDVLGDVAKGPDAISSFEERISEGVTKGKHRRLLVGLFSSWLREGDTNEEEFKQVVGESVLYGQVVQLRHVSTGKFMTIKRTAADVERGALKVVLEEGGQEGSWFQVFSGYRTKPEGAKLMPGEIVSLRGVAFPGNGLHMSTGDITDPGMLPVDKHPYVTTSKELSASPDLSAFKVIPFCMHPKVYPELRERMCGMNSVSIQDLVANTVYINLLGALSEKYIYFESPLTRPDPNRVGGPDSWRVELVVDGGSWCGMPLNYGCRLRIRHLPTGTYLAVLSSRAKEAAKARRDHRAAANEAGGVPPTPAAQASQGGSSLPQPRKGGVAGPEGAASAATLPATPTGANPAQMLKNAVALDEDVLHDEAFRVVLTKRYNVPDTLWELVTFSKEEPVGTKVYTFFKHVATGFWLSGASPVIPQPPPEDPDDPGEEQVYPVVHPEKLERNVMLVFKLPDEFTSKVLDLQRVAVQLRGMCSALNKEKVPPEAQLLELVAKDAEGKVLEALASTQFPDKFRLRYPPVKRSLKDLVRWLDKDTWNEGNDAVAPAHAEYQTLLREMGLMDAVVAYMESTRVRVFTTAKRLRATKLGAWVLESGKLCHRILQLACRGNEANQKYMNKYADMVMSHLSSPLTAPDTLAAMYEDNMAQMQTVTQDIVAASVKLIRLHGHQPRFINFLRQISGTRERPMPNNQNWIVNEIMGEGRSPLDVFCRASIGDSVDKAGNPRKTWIITCSRVDKPGEIATVDSADFGGDEEDLTKRAIKEWDLGGGDDAYSPRDLFIYYCYTLKFIVSLCYGRNSLVRNQILEQSKRHGLGLEFDALLRAVTNEHLPYGMRSYMVQVIRALYVDVEPYRPIKLPRHIRMLAKAGSGGDGTLGAGATNSEFIVRLIKTVLTQLQGVAAGCGALEEAPTLAGNLAKDMENLGQMVLSVSAAAAGAKGAEAAKAAGAAAAAGEPPAGSKEAKDAAALDAEELGKDTVGRNTLVLNLVKLVQEMFKLGMMELDATITQDMLSVLLDLLQRLDALPLHMPERFARTYASKAVMDVKKTALATIDFALDMKSEQQCAAIFERFAAWQRSPARQEYWALKASRPKGGGKSKALGGFLNMNRIRAAASLGGAGNRVAPAPGAEGHDPEAPPEADGSAEAEDGALADYGGLAQWVEEAFAALAADNEDGDFPLFKLDTVDDKQQLYRQSGSPIMKLVDLVRYDDQLLTAQTFALLERLTSKREKLLGELMRTFVVTDDELIRLSAFAAKQVDIAQHAYNYMGSLNPAEAETACKQAAGALNALTLMLQPLQHISLGAGGGGGEDRIFVSKAIAANCQYLLADMQVHLEVLKFLKLPLKRKPQGPKEEDKKRMQEADELLRAAVFKACLNFLRHFMVVGDMDSGAGMPSHPNQKAVLPSLELLLSFLDTRGLPASDTVMALFFKNAADAGKQGEKVIRRLDKLILRYGDKQHAGWLELMGRVMVVDGQPIKRNQMVAMQLITQHDDEVLYMMSGEAGLEKLMGLLKSEKLSAQSSETPVGPLAYHTACIALLADCCAGKEPELVVKASGYVSLAQAMDVLLLQPSPDMPSASLRYVQRAYWLLAKNCYFSTDTDNTKVQVRNGTNRIWPLDEKVAAGAGGAAGQDLLIARFLDLPAAGQRGATKAGTSCLIQGVQSEVEQALGDPSDALANSDSASLFLATAVFPALTEYFINHFGSHVSKLPVQPGPMLEALFNQLVKLHGSFRRLREGASSASVKTEIKMALAATKALLESLPAEANTTGRPLDATRGGLLAKGGKGGQDGSAPSMSQTTALTAGSQKVVQKEWMLYLRRLAAQISVSINASTNEIVEVLEASAVMVAAASTAKALGMGEGSVVFEQASLLRLARLMAAPFGRLVPATVPTMCYEELTAMLCGLLASRARKDGRELGGFSPALLVKLIRSIRAAVVLDDGRGAADESALKDAWASIGLLRYVDSDDKVEDFSEPPEPVQTWRQAKYDKLGATRAAVALLAHPLPEVQYEALELLEVLLQGGNRTVQATIFDILKDGSELSDRVFANMKASFDRCRKHVAKRSFATKGGGRAKKDSAAAAAGKALAGAALQVFSGGAKVAGLLTGKIFGGKGDKKSGKVSPAPDAGPVPSLPGTVEMPPPPPLPAKQISKRLSGTGLGSEGLGAPTVPNGAPVGLEPAASGGPGMLDVLPDHADSRAPPTSSARAPKAALPPFPSAGPASGRLPALAHAHSGVQAQQPSSEISAESPLAAAAPAAPASLPDQAGGSGGGAPSSSASRKALGSPADEASSRKSMAAQASSKRALPPIAAKGGAGDGDKRPPAADAGGQPGGDDDDDDDDKPRAGPVAEGTETTAPTDAGGEGGEEDDDELQWEDKVAKLNAADSAYEFSRVLLRTVKLMVEGHYKNLQRLLQCQTNSVNTVDLVVEAVELLGVLQDHLPLALVNADKEVPDLMVLVCLFVQEMVQGPCLSNQVSLAGTSFLASCNRIFGCIEYEYRQPGWGVEIKPSERKATLSKCAIKTSLLDLLMSLLESCPSDEIPSRCYDILDFSSIDRQIGRLCKLVGLSDDEAMYPTDEAEGDFESEPELAHVRPRLERELLLMCAYVLKLHSVTPLREAPLPYLTALWEGEDVAKLEEELTPDQALYAASLQDFLRRRLGYVEINWKGLLEPCFFALTPECSAVVTSAVWNTVTLDRINNTVSPDSRAFPTVKAAELVDVLEDVVDDISLGARLMTTSWLKAVSLLTQYRMLLLQLTFYLAVSALIFQALADARWSPSDLDNFSDRKDSWETLVLTAAVMLQTFVTVLLYISFVYTDLNKRLSHDVPAMSARLSEIGATVREALTFGGGKDGKGGRDGKDGGGGGGGGGGGKAKDKEEEGLSLGSAAARKLGLPPPPEDERAGWLDWSREVLAFFVALFTYPKFWYFNMLVAASVVGLLLSPFFLVFHFTIYFLDFDSGKQLVLAIQRSGIAILNTFVLAVLAIYTFAVVTFLAFRDPTRVDKGDGPPCETFYQCMGAHMLTGIMGDISALFNSDLWDTVPEQVQQDGMQQARTVFVLLFFMLWNFVLSNIFVGLIASAFEAIRDDQNTITSDRLSKCLVCSQDMYLFNEKIQGGFDEHVLRQHNALSYVFFLHHLRATDVEDYTGAESAVSAVLASAKTSTDKGTWLPVGKSLAVAHAIAVAERQAAIKEGGGEAGNR